MTINIEKLSSGLISVWFDDDRANASIGTKEQAKAIVNGIIKAENAKQNNENKFSDIEIVFC